MYIHIYTYIHTYTYIYIHRSHSSVAARYSSSADARLAEASGNEIVCDFLVVERFGDL